MSPPTPPQAAKPKPRWELRALGLSAGVVVLVGGLSRLLFGLVGPLAALAGLDGLAAFLSGLPTALAFVTALILNGIAATTESRGAGLGAWLGLGLIMLVFRGLAAL
ncbi:MAG: hypothetical protein KUG77_04305 [Nannocystaceae bacterium]|nr:hypothetical protein [Nannocystaceae bacterium]